MGDRRLLHQITLTLTLTLSCLHLSCLHLKGRAQYVLDTSNRQTSHDFVDGALDHPLFKGALTGHLFMYNDRSSGSSMLLSTYGRVRRAIKG